MTQNFPPPCLRGLEIKRAPASSASAAENHLRVTIRSELGCLSGRLRASVGREFEHRFAHFFAGLELDHRARRDADGVCRSVRIQANAGLAHFDFEYPKVSQFNFFSLSNSFGDVIESLLDDVEDALLNQAGLVADADDQVTLCHRTFIKVGCFAAGLTMASV